MRTRLLLAALLLPSALVAAPIAEACGPYGEVRHTLAGNIVSDRPASAGLELRAACGGERFEVVVADDGSFELRGVREGECVLEAIAHECYTWDRSVALQVSVPSERVTIVIPVDR